MSNLFKLSEPFTKIKKRCPEYLDDKESKVNKLTNVLIYSIGTALGIGAAMLLEVLV